MQNECNICCESKIIMPCGAFNNCDATVCDSCKYYDVATTCPLTCMYCKTINYKALTDAIITELVDGDFRILHKTPYVLLDKFLIGIGNDCWTCEEQ